MILGLAPMDWFTDCAMRQITQNIFDKYWNKSDYDLWLWTEFMTADGYSRNPWWVIKHLLTNKDQKNLIAQIFWWNQETLVKTAIDIQNKYWSFFKWIELNIWCPANNVMKSWWWAQLLTDKKNTLKIIQSLKSNLDLPFSIKTRTGLNEKDKKDQTEFILESSKYCSMITIHWRTLVWWYSEDPNRDFIYNIKKLANKNCKVFWNGWIKSYQEIESYYKWNRVILDWVMIWQAAIWNPRAFTTHTPDKKELKETIIKHLNLMLDYELQFQKNIKTSWDIQILLKNSKLVDTTIEQPRLMVEFRKHLFNYVKWIPWSKEFKQKIAQIKDYENIVNEINNFLK
jgi:tRNA-dihydrouridine synthase